MANRDKLTHLMKKAAPFIANVSGDVNEETVSQDIQAILMAMETHKAGADHEPYDHAWAGNNSFLKDILVNTILPLMPDTYDIGSDTYRFRKGFFSELSSLIFKKENVVIMDGQFLVTKMAGALPADTMLGTTIDFGRTMTVGDFVLFRNEGQVEYMKITFAAGGTLYRVLRNLDGSGANNWLEGTPFAVLGSEGEGWLELNAVDRKRFSVWAQGSAYNNSLEIGRYGDITGWQNATFTGIGIALGDYANGKYLVYTTVNGMVINGGTIIAGNGNVVIDQNGLRIYSNTVYNEFVDPSSIKFIHDGTTFGAIQGAGSPSDVGISMKIEGAPGQAVSDLDIAIAKGTGIARKLLNTFRESTSSPYVLDKATYNNKVSESESLIEIEAEHNHLNSDPVHYHTALLKLWATIAESLISLSADKVEITAPNGITVNNPIILPATDPTLPNNAVRKAYVDMMAGGGGGVTDHGALSGLLDNDHPQYLLAGSQAADSNKLNGQLASYYAIAAHNHAGLYVDLTSGQTIAGTKTFSVLPVLPTSTPGVNNPVRKGYADATYVGLTGDETIAGVKTFSSIPVLPATNPTLANQAVRKGYADAAYLSISGKAADADKLDGVDSSAFGRPVFLTTPLTSTAWDGDAYSTTLKTKIDLSSVFSVPAGVKAVLVQLIARDSGSAASTNIFFGISPNNTDASCPVMAVGRGLPNDTLVYATGVCPCDANGDIYYQIVASGVGTMDCYIRIWGYWL